MDLAPIFQKGVICTDFWYRRGYFEARVYYIAESPGRFVKGAEFCPGRGGVVRNTHMIKYVGNKSNAMRAAHAVAPNLAPPSEERLPVREIKPLAHSKYRRRRRGAPPRRHQIADAVAFSSFSHFVPSPSKDFWEGRYVANRRSINSQYLPKWTVYFRASSPTPTPVESLFFQCCSDLQY